MDQQYLRELEGRCIQEEPPLCTAACPLHVDARAFAGHIGGGRWEEARKILNRFMPLPGILGRICDAPCKLSCKRKEVGDAIDIGALERVCVETVRGTPRTAALPAKAKQVAVAGSGLSSLTVAWDLLRKGYGVTLFEAGDRPAAPLYRLAPDRLPTEAVQVETDKLIALGVVTELNVPMTAPGTWTRWMTSFDALYLGLDAVSEDSWDIDRDSDGAIRVAEKTQCTGRKNVFAGGRSRESANSPVYQVAEGRWAATSMDRFMQAVSMTAGREKEGPFPTRLFTSLAGVVPIPRVPMADPIVGYTRAEAEIEAGRCLACECMECVKVCVYLEHYKAYPKKYAREIYNNAAIVMGERKANKLINSCSLCGLCERVCPNDFAMQDLCLTARREMATRGKMPPSAHEFALLDLAFSRSEHFSLVRHAPGLTSGTYAFFPGCQLCASAPDQVEAAYFHLRRSLTGGIGLILGCCGAPALWAGEQALFSEAAADVKRQWTELGSPRLVLACASRYKIFKTHLPDVSIESLWQVLEKVPPPNESVAAPPGPLAIHDPCTTRYEPEIRQTVRRLLNRMGADTFELDLGGEFTECCGYGGLMQTANPELSRDVAIRRGSRNASDYLTYCAVCRDNLAAVGKRAVYLMDLLFPGAGQPDPAGRPRPGWSQRQENRIRLKARMMTRLWHEGAKPMEPHRNIRLHVSPEVAERLEARRILVEDVQRVIHHAETGGDKLFHPQTGHFKAAHTPYKTTFWVEYSPASDGFDIHNAYMHRMEVIGP